MMGRGQVLQRTGLQPLRESAVADLPRLLLDRGLGRQVPFDGEYGVGDAEAFAEVGDLLGLPAALRAEAVIDRRRFDVARSSRRREQEQCEAVRPSGDGDPDPCSGWNEPV